MAGVPRMISYCSSAVLPKPTLQPSAPVPLSLSASGVVTFSTLEVGEVRPDGGRIAVVIAVLHPHGVPLDGAEARQPLLERLVVPRAMRVNVLQRVAEDVHVAVEHAAAGGAGEGEAFRLVTRWPRTVTELDDGARTVRAAGLKPADTLFVEKLEKTAA